LRRRDRVFSFLKQEFRAGHAGCIVEDVEWRTLAGRALTTLEPGRILTTAFLLDFCVLGDAR